MTAINHWTHDFVYAVFKNGKTIEYQDFSKARIVNSAEYFIRRILNRREQTSMFGNEYYYYDFETVDHNESLILPEVGGYKIINISSFFNTASYPIVHSNIVYRLIDIEGRLIEFEVKDKSSIATLELLYTIVSLIQGKGGLNAYKITNDDKNIRFVGDKIIYEKKL